MTEERSPARKPAATKAPATPRRGPGGRFVAGGKPEEARPTQAKPAQSKGAGSKPSAKRAKAEPSADKASGPLSLVLIRHADAGDSATWEGDDAARPLSKKGRRQSKRLGELLADLRVRPDVLLTSPRVRALDTAKLVGRAIGTKPAIDKRLDAGFGADALGAIVSDLPASAGMLAIVGHDPDFSHVASWLADAPLSMSKGALVRIELPERAVGAGKGTLRWLLPPDAVAG